MRYFLNKVIQKVVVFFMPSRIVFERSPEEIRESTRIRTEEELALRAGDLKEICAFLDELSIPYYLSGGTLLGIVRGGDFIAWDGDVDIDVRIEDVYPKQAQLMEAFVKAGYKIKVYKPSNIDFRIRAAKHGSVFEVIGFFKMGDKRYRKWSYYPDSFTRDKSEVSLRGERYKTFAVPERYLEWYYGDWRTPIRDGNHHKYVTAKSRTGPFALMLLRIAAMCTKF